MMKWNAEVDFVYFEKIISICDSIMEYRSSRGIRYPCGLIIFSIFFGGMRTKI